MVSRCALYLTEPRAAWSLAHERGLRRGRSRPAGAGGGGRGRCCEALRDPLPVAELPPGALRERLAAAAHALVVPLSRRARGRASWRWASAPRARRFTEEDRDFALTLARQAVAALETVRLHRVQLEKQRQDRELQIAREIQQSLFPRRPGDRPASSWRRTACPATRWAATTTTSSPCPAGAGPGHRGRLRQGHARQHPDGLRARLAAGAGRHRPPGGAHGAAQPLPLREHAGQQVRDALLRGAGPAPRRLALRERRPRAAVPLRRGRRARAAGRGRARCWACSRTRATRWGRSRWTPGDVVAMVTDGVTEALSPEDGEFGDERRRSTCCAARRRARTRQRCDGLVERGRRLGGRPPAAPTT